MYPRIIDANANRAREALRVMEDTARFVLEDPALTESIKNLRHDFQDAVGLLPYSRAALMASRDTPGDVGTSIKTPGEVSRGNLASIAAAAASRLGQALRTIEEFAKLIPDRNPFFAFEKLRYRGYEVEKNLILALEAMAVPRARQWRLCVLLTESLCTHHTWRAVADCAIDAGADCLQLREKSLPDRELLLRAKALVQLAHEHEVAVVINDRPDLAILAGADGVHLGQSDISIEDARTLAGTRLLIGVSTENIDQARAAHQAGADYIALGPMFPTTTKEKPRLAGPDYIRRYMADEHLNTTPHLAIGGITPANVCDLRAAGCRGIAVSSFVCSAKDPTAACRELLRGMS